MAFTNIWDVTYPPDVQAANLLGADLRNFRLDVQQRMGAISGADALKPTFSADAQPNNWNGVLYFATDTGKIYQWQSPAWIDVTLAIKGGAETPVSTVRQTGADFLTASNVPVNFLILGNLQPNTNYSFDCWLFYQMSAITSGLGITFVGPAAPSNVYFGGWVFNSPVSVGGVAASGFGSTITFPFPNGGNVTFLAQLYGSVENGPNAGNLALQVYSSVAGPTLRMMRGCFATLRI